MNKTIITVKSNSALKVEGAFEIIDESGNRYDVGDRTVVSLCRCGLSAKMPFCDGAHKTQFKHEATAFPLLPTPPKDR
jgi:CDGSH-type Zn-finger protein